MDTARRWQVASLATAVAGLGLGSLLVGRSPSTEIAPIDLDLVVVSTEPDLSSREERRPVGPEIVPPVIREDTVELPAPSGRSRDAVGDTEVVSQQTPTASVASPAAPAPAAPRPDVSLDSDDSIDSSS